MIDENYKFLSSKVKELNYVVKQIWFVLSEHHSLSDKIKDSIAKQLEDIEGELSYLEE